MKKRRLHFMGIGGQGISAVAQMAHQAGEVVTGCDRQPSATVRALEHAGISVGIGHSQKHLEGVETLVISPAVTALDPHNPELLAAAQKDIDTITWQDLLGELMQGKCSLSVCGAHGKSTTTSMLALILLDAGLDPTCEIGAVVPRLGANYRLGNGQYFVNEADEYNHNFWHYHPRLVLVRAIEFDHPEFFADYEALLAAFEHFIRGMDMQGDWPLPPTIVIDVDSTGCLDLLERLHDWPGRIVTYGMSSNVKDYKAFDVKLVGETSFRVRAETDRRFPDGLVIQLQLPGVHNVQNALAALTAAHVLGIEAETIAKTLASFGGTRRRFEIRHQGPLDVEGRMIDVVLVDDYAHHPTAVRLTLEAARQRYPGRRIVAVYQPHMYSRTKTFFEQFLQAFDAADVAILADIFPAREQDLGIVHTRDLVRAMELRPHFSQESARVIYGGDVRTTTELLNKMLKTGDVVLIMGAGDIYTVTEQLERNVTSA